MVRIRAAVATVATAALALCVPLTAAIAQLSDSTRARIDAVFARYDRTDSPGCALGIAEHGRELYTRAYGMSDFEHGQAIAPSSIFHVASISKQFAAFSVALLANDGRLSLDDDIHKFIPELPDYATRITVRQLMHHTSGLRDQWQLLKYAGWRDDDLITEDDVLGIVAKQKGLNFTPGDEWLYSNTGFTLLAVIVKRVSGQSLHDFAQERIFAPLGMRDTHFHDDHTMIVVGRTSAYEPRAGGGWKISIPVFDTYGATSLFTTASDLLKWMANLDAPTVGNVALVAAAQTSGVLNDGTPIGYGYGLTLGKYRTLTAIGHGGADAGYRAQVERYPERGIAVAVLCNVSTAVPALLLHSVADVLLGTAVPKDVASIDTLARTTTLASKQRWVGTYRDTVSQQVLRVKLRGDSLFLGDGRYLNTTGDTSVRIAQSGTALILQATGGTVTGVTMMPRTTRPLVFRREMPVAPDRAALAAYEGSYYSDELDVTYTLSVTDSGLVAKHRKLAAMRLTPAVADAFTVDNRATVIFARDRARKVEGFTLTDGRARGVRFARVK